MEANSYIETEEDIKFGSEGPLKTQMKLSIGPMIMMIIMSLHDIIDVAFTKASFDANRLSIVVISSSIRMIVYGLSVITATGQIVKTTQLVAENNYEGISRLFVDIFRINILMQIIIPIAFIPAFPQIASALGVSNENISSAREYLLPVIFECLFIGLFQNTQSVLIGLARANLTALIQLGDFIFSAIIVDAIVCFGFKGPLWLQGGVYYIGQVIMSIVFTVLFFMGKFGFKPTLKMFFMKPSNELLGALKLCSQAFAMLIFNFLSSFVFTLHLTKAGEAIGQKQEVATVASSAGKPLSFLLFMVKGSNLGLQSAGTWAVNKKLYRRTRNLFFAALIIPLTVYAIVMPMMVFTPKIIMQLFIDTSLYSKLIEQIVPKTYYLKIMDPVMEAILSLMLATNNGLLASVPVIVENLAQMASGIGIYYTHKARPDLIAFGITIGQASSIITMFCIAAWKLKDIYLSKGDEDYSRIIDRSELDASVA